MDHKKFLNEHIKPGKTFLAGMISLDIIGHSKIQGNKQEIAKTRRHLSEFINAQFASELGALLPWQGDGGFLIFDISDGCDELIMFADKIRQLLPLFNRTKGRYNRTTPHHDLALRIVCDAGTLLNQDGDPGTLYGHVFNTLAKKEREIGFPGFVSLTHEIYQELSPDLAERCILKTNHELFGEVYILDGKLSLSSLSFNEKRSIELKEWILANSDYRDFTRLRYFAYTNELLFDFFRYQLSGLEVQILTRNWLVEADDEKSYNATLESGKQPWDKAELIKLIAKKITDQADELAKPIKMRFYKWPPLFNGAILEGDGVAPKAYLGFSRWEKKPDRGSQYKLEAWPAMVLDGVDEIQAEMIKNLSSRFDLMWDRGLSYEQVVETEDELKARDPSNVGKIWKLDRKPYLILYPVRKSPSRPYPVAAIEDLRAFHLLEKFLNRYGSEVKLVSFEIQKDHGDGELPNHLQNILNEWEGHVVYICTKSLTPSLITYLSEINFPYEFSRIGVEKPFMRHHKDRDRHWKSPTDNDPPEPRDYGMIARFSRGKGDSLGYLALGTRAMGTWGAALYLTTPKDIRILASMVKNTNFVAFIEAKFDPSTYELESSSLRLPPESF